MRVPQQSPIHLAVTCAALPDLWSPRVLGQVNNHFVKIARIQGDFPWHTHEHEDELFLVLSGCMRIGREPANGGPVDVHAGEFFVVPRGTRHNTSTPDGQEALIALIEPVQTLHTGSEQTPLTRTIAEQLGELA